ncbi:glycoside hydrolase family 3 protein [Xylariaceae sp. FL0255]|nr:glycoside hydrolase family 3 protein [Xylariaceae sp. FL0255]
MAIDLEVSAGSPKDYTPRPDFDARYSSDLSDVDATEFLQSDPLNSSPRRSPYTPFPIRSRSHWLGKTFSCCAGRSKRCIIISVITFVLLWIFIGTGGLFAFKKWGSAPPDGLSPPWYPTPKGGTTKKWAESYKKASEMVANMTLPEKVNITTGTGWQMGPAVGNTGPAVNVGFPSLALHDGPLGIRFTENATAFPAGVTVAATWNRDLMYQWGNAHGIEAKGKGTHAVLGPCIGPIGRMPAGGRNWEGFGSDPYLAGIAAAQSIRGMQDAGVMATIKHLVANEQEHFRQPHEWGLANAISTNIDDRTMHELYLWPFGNAIKAGVASIMCSYNQVNNSYACGNSKLLNGLIRDEMGFQGFIMSDWLAQRGGVSTALAGLDMTMPGDGLFWAQGKSLWGPELTKSVLNGSVPMDRLNDMVTRIVAAWYQMGQDDENKFPLEGPNFSSWTDEEYGVAAPGSPTEQPTEKVNEFVNVMADHASIARLIAAEGTVLLKNEGLLPITREGLRPRGEHKRDDTPIQIVIIGEDAGAGKGPNYCENRNCNQGTLASGWGSGAVEFPYLVTPDFALSQAWDNRSVIVSNHSSNDLPKSSVLRQADVCIVFANADSGEGAVPWEKVKGDRPDLFLQKGGDDLIIKVAKRCHGDVLVVIHTVGPVIMERWINLPNIKAVLLANLPGEESGNALADVILGYVNPSGRLPWTIGKSLDDYGAGGQIMYTPNGFVPQQDFKEGLYTDYRHFDKYDIEPRFEFGFGLSYTQFKVKNGTAKTIKEKSALPIPRPGDFARPPEYDTTIPNATVALFPKGFHKLEKYVYPYLDDINNIGSGTYPYPDGYDIKQPPSEAGGDEGGNPDLWETYVEVSVDIQNTGPHDGHVVAQLYLSYPESSTVDFPIKVLRGFEKVAIEGGEIRTVTFNLMRRDLSYWDVTLQNWVMLTEGQYTFHVGQSSRDLPVSVTW